MLSKCLNPQCTAKFRYLWEGRLFRVDFAEVKRRKKALTRMAVLCAGEHPSKPEAGLNLSPATADDPGTPEKERPIEHFWLCALCAANWTIEVSDEGEVRLAKLPPPPETILTQPQNPKLVAAS